MIGPAAMSGPTPGDGERSNTGEQAQGSSDNSAGCCTRCRAFRGLGCLLMSECTSAVGIRHQNGYVVISNTGRE